MCAYNKVNGAQACGNDRMLNGILKGDWGYKGWVMSDWGSVRATDFALHDASTSNRARSSTRRCSLASRCSTRNQSRQALPAPHRRP